MKKLSCNIKKQGLWLLSFLLIVGLLAGGCNKTPGQEPQPPAIQEPADSGPKEDSVQSETSSFPEYTFKDGEISFRGYNAATDSTETFVYKIPAAEKQTLNTVLTAYNELYVVPVLEGTPISANSIILEDSALKIDFTETIYGNYGSGTEAALLDNLFLAFFDNIPEVKEIYVSVNGGAYETGHIMINPDEAITKSDLL